MSNVNKNVSEINIALKGWKSKIRRPHKFTWRITKYALTDTKKAVQHCFSILRLRGIFVYPGIQRAPLTAKPREFRILYISHSNLNNRGNPFSKYSATLIRRNGSVSRHNNSFRGAQLLSRAVFKTNWTAEDENKRRARFVNHRYWFVVENMAPNYSLL